MTANVKSLSEFTRREVFTSKGSHCGKVADVEIDMERFKVKSIVIDSMRGSFFSNLVGDKRGVVVPYSMVQSIGDIIIIKHIPAQTDDMEEKPASA